jgi:glutathione S-transferase
MVLVPTMVLKLYGHPTSHAVQKVQITLAETNAPYEFVLIDLLAGAHRTPELLARNPLGYVPCIVRATHPCTFVPDVAQNDDGSVLFESAAIARYLVLKASSSLVPTRNLHAVARHEQALAL